MGKTEHNKTWPSSKEVLKKQEKILFFILKTLPLLSVLVKTNSFRRRGLIIAQPLHTFKQRAPLTYACWQQTFSFYMNGSYFPS